MQSDNKIYSFFIVLALLFWNPISYFLIYDDAPLFSERVNHIFFLIYSIIFLSGILLMYLIQKDKLNEKIKNIIFTIAFAGILFSSLVFVDSLIGLTLKKEVTRDLSQERLIFKPHSKARYKTIEFEFVADINSLGLRDREIHLEKGDKYRVLCFGDSFTFGWGVNVENSWPKKLEQYLLGKGYANIEVINCGRGGQYTRTYKKYIEKAVPLLKPDLVLVGILQLDDLAQLYEYHFIKNQTYENANILKNYTIKIKYVFINYLKFSFKNIFSLISNRELKKVDIKSNWEESANSIIKNFKHLQKIRFYTLDDTVQSLFKSGNLNAGLLNYYINYPDRTIIFNNPNHSATKFSAHEMNKDLKGMKEICHKYKSNLIFINLPNNYFTGHIVIRTPTDLINSYFEINNNIDPIYRSIANANNLTYIELTKHFIGLKNKSEYFFRYDGHPNKKGYEEIAKYIGKQLIEQDILKKEK
jgi:lysophospholipase L1-like esterase